MKPKLVFLVSEDWYFLSHRLPMAQAAQAAGYEVHVATRVVDGAAAIERHGFVLHPVPWQRGSIDPLHIVRTVTAVHKLYRRIKPDIVHHVAFAPSVVGSIAALGMDMAKLNALAGLGFVFTSNSNKARLLRPFARHLLAFLLQRPATYVLVQNPDDAAMVARLGIAQDRIALIPGSGVDIEAMTPLPEPQEPFTVGFVGRLLYDKGVETLVRAHDLLQRRGFAVRVLLAGTPDPSNPSSIPQEILSAWQAREGIEMLGHVTDVRTIWARAHVAVLPSRREGLPKSLLEAAACGRPLIATDVPGCRDVVRPGIDGLLVPPDDAAALADAIERLMRDTELRLRLANAARDIVVNEFSSDRVGRDIVALYARLLADPSTAAVAVGTAIS